MVGYLKDQETILSQDPRMLKMEHLTYLRACTQLNKTKNKQKPKNPKFPEGTDQMVQQSEGRMIDLAIL